MDDRSMGLVAASDGLVLVDRDMRIVAWDKGAERILGYLGEQVLGRRCYEILRGRDSGSVCGTGCPAHRRAMRGDPPPTTERILTARDGSPVRCRVGVLACECPSRPSPLALHILHPERGLRLGAGLTPREALALELLASGLTVPAISATVGRSANTIRNQVRSACTKLGAATAAHAVAIYLGHRPIGNGGDRVHERGRRTHVGHPGRATPRAHRSVRSHH